MTEPQIVAGFRRCASCGQWSEQKLVRCQHCGEDWPAPKTSMAGPIIAIGCLAAGLLFGTWLLYAQPKRMPEVVRSTLADKMGIAAEREVLRYLKAPSSAKFSSTFAFEKTIGKWIASGAVDSQNSFGAMLRDQWLVVLQENPGGNPESIYVRIGDTQHGELPAGW